MDRAVRLHQPPHVALFANTRSAFAIPTLQELAKLRESRAIELVGIVATERPEPLSSRLRSMLRRVVTRTWDAPNLRTLAQELGIPVLTPSSLDVNDDQVVGFLKDTQTDVALIFGCDQILRQKLIAATPLVVNYHNSLLPKYRGVGATVWPFLHGEAESGFSYHTIDDEKIDVGRLVLQSKVPMPPLAEAHSYSDKLNEAAARALPALITTLTTRGDFARLPPTEEYFSLKMFNRATLADPYLSVDEACKRAMVIGHLLLRRGPVVLRLQRPHKRRSGWSDLAISFADGNVWFSRINYVPAILCAPVVRLMWRR